MPRVTVCNMVKAPLNSAIRTVLRYLALALAFFILLPHELRAQGNPISPCEGVPRPFYADAGAQPSVQVLKGDEAKRWKPAACTGWREGESHVVVALAGTLPGATNIEELLDRFGAVSALQGVRYWSVSDQQWRLLISSSNALDSPDPDRHRPDFSAVEMRDGTERYFVQSDTRSTGNVVYRMRVKEATRDRIMLEMENVTPVRILFVPIFQPGALKSLYFIDHLDGARWGYYSLLSANSTYADGNESSMVNRAVALYRRFIGVPTDDVPPLAP